MDNYTVFPNQGITANSVVSDQFLKLGVNTFADACRYVHQLPYGYNSNRDDLMILFKEGFGACSTKHAVIATLAEELDLPVHRAMGIYAMTEEIVEGANEILATHGLPYVPMIHCFLVYGDHRVDLTEGNFNGKRRAINAFLYTAKVLPAISAKDEYLIYRTALKDSILKRSELAGIAMKDILHAREKGLSLLKANLKQSEK